MVTATFGGIASGQSLDGGPLDGAPRSSAASGEPAADAKRMDSHGLIMVGQQTIDRAMVERWLAEQAAGTRAARVGAENSLPTDAESGVPIPTRSNGEAGPNGGLSTLEWAVLGNLARRAVALERLRALGGRALEARIERRWQQIETLRTSRESGGDSNGAEGGVRSLDRTTVAWDVAWNEYLRQQLTIDNLERFFAAFHYRYDGTEALVRQIFLPRMAAPDEVTVSEGAAAEEAAARPGQDVATGGSGAEKAVSGAKVRLTQIALRVRGGGLSFADAAREYSRSPSGRDGGLVGWVTGQGDLPAELSEVALTGALVEPLGPIRTRFGWHLLWVEERRPGRVDFDAFENREVLRSDAARYLFDRLVREGLEQVDVRWHPSFSPPANLPLARLLATP